MSNIEKLIKSLVEYNDKELPLSEVKEIYLRRSKHTNRSATHSYYEKHLSIIIDYFYNHNLTSTETVTHENLFKFINYQKSRGLKNNTVNKSLGTLKQALKYCETLGLIAENPMRRFEKLPKDDVETVTIDSKTLKTIFNYLNNANRTKSNLRLKAMIYVLLDTGVRRNELRNILLKDVDLNSKTIYLRYTKTKKNRTLLFSEITSAVLSDYIEFVGPQTYLLESFTTGERIELLRYDHIMHKLKRKLNIESSISFHKFRHTYATQCLESGADLEFIRKTLGHSDISTTQKYLHVSSTKLREQHDKFSPILSL